MTTMLRPLWAMLCVAALALSLASCATSTSDAGRDLAMAPPTYHVDASWPKPLPGGWIFGQVAGNSTDSEDHVWVIQRPRSLTMDERGATLVPPRSNCCAPAPPVLEFDSAGNLLRSWGGPGQGYDWPQLEHGIYVDAKGFVWITGAGGLDGQVLKFRQDGTFVMQIGKSGKQTTNADITRLGQPASLEVDVAANEVYIADGYYNNRVIVFDSETGAFKRLWGAYGKVPSDVGKPTVKSPEELALSAPPTARQGEEFGNPVHCARLSRDGFVYVCDRANDRLQVFTKDGRFVKQFVIEPATAGLGSVWDIAFSRDPAQRWIYLADGGNNQILMLNRETGERVGAFGRPGRYAGEFHWVHDMSMDSHGNIYAGEVDTGKRIQKFVPRP